MIIRVIYYYYIIIRVLEILKMSNVSKLKYFEIKEINMLYTCIHITVPAKYLLATLQLLTSKQFKCPFKKLINYFLIFPSKIYKCRFSF